VGRHDSQKVLAQDFDTVWKRLKVSGKKSLQTPNGHNFDALATEAAKGYHQGEKVIRVTKDGRLFALIYSCCWRHTTNNYGTRIGGYSDALNKWAGTMA
jgi:hypothetical protein